MSEMKDKTLNKQASLTQCQCEFSMNMKTILRTVLCMNFPRLAHNDTNNVQYTLQIIHKNLYTETKLKLASLHTNFNKARLNVSIMTLFANDSPNSLLIDFIQRIIYLPGRILNKHQRYFAKVNIQFIELYPH